jgi:uncharacterized protein
MTGPAAETLPRGRSAGVRWVIVSVTFLAGVAMLTVTLHLEPGDETFVLTALATAAIWAVGARACGPLPMRGPTTQAGIAAVVGCLALLLCLAVAVVVADIPFLAQPAEDLLAHRGTAALPVMVLITALNSVAEEMYFRGALYTTVSARFAWIITAIAYTLATLPSEVLLLSTAAALLGALTGLLRRATGGLLAPVVAHLIWSLGMLFLLPIVLVPGS